MKLDKFGKNAKPKPEKEPFVSGAFNPDEIPEPKKAAAEIAEETAKKGRFKKSLHQPYDSKATPGTKQITNRILGEKDED